MEISKKESLKDKLKNHLKKIFSSIKEEYETEKKLKASMKELEPIELELSNQNNDLKDEKTQDEKKQDINSQENAQNAQLIKKNTELKEMLKNCQKQYNLVVNLYRENEIVINEVKSIFRIFFVSKKEKEYQYSEKESKKEFNYKLNFYERIPFSIIDYTEALIKLKTPFISKVYDINDFKNNQKTIDELEEAYYENYTKTDFFFDKNIEFLETNCKNILDYRITKLRDNDIIEIIEKNPHILGKKRVINLIKDDIIDKITINKIVEIIENKPHVLKDKRIRELMINQKKG